MANKVRFGLKHLYYAKYIPAVGTASASYATPVAIPGAVSVSLAPEGNSSAFYADDFKFFSTDSNNGYSGDVEVATLPDSFRKDILGEVEDSNGMLVETDEVKDTKFALLFEIDGDQEKRRIALYMCNCARPNVNAQTRGETIEPQTETFSITAVRNDDGHVKAIAPEGSDNYDDFFTAVQKPDFTPPSP